MRICPVCGKEYSKGVDMCPVCLAKKNREYYRSLGICPYCHEARIFEGEKACPECRAEFANHSMDVRQANREHTNKMSARSHKASYWKRREAGICVRCGKRKAVPGLSRCGICRAKKSVENRKYLENRGEWIPRGERVANGLCYVCGKPLDREGRSCTKCAAKKAEVLVYARTKIMERPWKIPENALYWKLREERRKNEV